MSTICQRRVADDLHNQQALRREARKPRLIPGLGAAGVEEKSPCTLQVMLPFPRLTAVYLQRVD